MALSNEVWRWVKIGAERSVSQAGATFSPIAGVFHMLALTRLVISRPKLQHMLDRSGTWGLRVSGADRVSC